MQIETAKLTLLVSLCLLLGDLVLADFLSPSSLLVFILRLVAVGLGALCVVFYLIAGVLDHRQRKNGKAGFGNPACEFHRDSVAHANSASAQLSEAPSRNASAEDPREEGVTSADDAEARRAA